MRILSATEAISPAIARTKLVLFKPFRLGRGWKFCAAAHVSTNGSFYLPFPLLFFFFVPVFLHEEPKWMIWAVVGGIVAALALQTFIFVLCSRLQFPVMDIVLNRSQFIAPLWRQYGPQSHRWAHAKIVIGTIATLVLAIPCAIFFWMSAHGNTSHPVVMSHQPFPVPANVAFFGFFGIVIFVYGALILMVLTMSLLNDFVLPPLALEDATLADAWQIVRNLVSAELGQVALYALLKFVLGFIAQMAGVIIIEIVFFLLMMVFGLLGALLSTLLHAGGVPSAILTALTIVTFGLLYVGLLYAMTFAYGIPIVFLEAYKLYFLGGRYPLLGDLLDRSTPPSEPMTPPPNYLAYASPPPTYPPSNEAL